MKNAEASYQRLKSVLVNDKLSSPSRLCSCLQSEILFLLSSYMDVSKDSVKVDLTLTASGEYEVKIKASAKRLKNLGHIV